MSVRLHPSHSAAQTRPLIRRMRAFYALTKPRVVSLIVFTAVIGMFLATPGMVPVQILLAATLGIASVAGAAAAVNCLVEQKIDAVMQRTRARPLPRGELSSLQTLVFAGMLGGIGLWLLVHFVNPLTMWLTLATFVGYAIVYTVILKPMTPQNIVIGGAAGAMPPVLGWAAVTGEVTTEALLLFLIIFAWTPPHFWALALYRTEEYAKAGLPMAAGHSWQALHPTAGAALFAAPVRCVAAAVRDPHERLAVSCRGLRARCDFHRLRDRVACALQRPPRPARFPLFDRLSRAAVCGAAC